MTSQQIRYFISAARHLNFTKAAEEFFSSQPTVSRQIAMLEEDWASPCFTGRASSCASPPADW